MPYKVNMANNYDRIFKENIDSLLLPLLKKILGLIPPKLVPIDAKMQMKMVRIFFVEAMFQELLHLNYSTQVLTNSS